MFLNRLKHLPNGTGVARRGITPTAQQRNLSVEELRNRGFNPPSTDGMQTSRVIGLFRQFHNREEFKDKPVVLERVAQSQKGIFDDLLVLKPKHIFLEGRYEKQNPNDQIPLMREAMHMIFGDYQPTHPLTARQSEALRELGAARVYFFLCSDVTLHPTTHKQLSDEDDAYVAANSEDLSKPGPITPEQHEVLCVRREERATECVRKFWAEHGEEPVAMVFGARHKLGSMYLTNAPIERQIAPDRPETERAAECGHFPWGIREMRDRPINVVSRSLALVRPSSEDLQSLASRPAAAEIRLSESRRVSLSRRLRSAIGLKLARFGFRLCGTEWGRHLLAAMPPRTPDRPMRQAACR
jgi:hypothetical protein